MDTMMGVALSRELAAQQAADIHNISKSKSISVDDDNLVDPDEAMQLRQRVRPTPSSTSMHCYGCGSKSHIHGNSKCPAKNKQCFNCGNKGHFNNVCRSQVTNRLVIQTDTNPKTVNQHTLLMVNILTSTKRMLLRTWRVVMMKIAFSLLVL